MDEFLKLRLDLDEAITYGNIKSAKVIAEKGLDLSNKKNLQSEIEYFKGQLALLREDYLIAIGHFDNAIKINPKDGAAYNDRALCMIELGVIENAFTYFDRGIKAEPDFATIHHNKGWLLNKTGKYDEAIECFKKALELSSDRPVTYENLAVAYANKGSKRTALIYYNKAVKILKSEYKETREELKRQIEKLKKERKGK
jgi:Tfp pilus assembly protein PilF